MTEDFLDWLTFIGWMAVPIAIGCAVLWALRPPRYQERDELDEPPTETIETRRRMNDA